MLEIYIHPHALIHGISESEIRAAWENFVAKTNRDMPKDDQIVCVGFNPVHGRPVQMIGVHNENGILIYHANTPPQESVLKELGIDSNKKMEGKNGNKHRGKKARRNV